MAPAGITTAPRFTPIFFTAIARVYRHNVAWSSILDNMGIGLTLRSGFVEEFAKRFISTFWVELEKLFLWHDPSHMLVKVMNGLGELLTVIEVATDT